MNEETIELTIERIAFRGPGVAHAGSVVCFVPETCPGERVRACVVRRRKNYWEARVKAVLESGDVSTNITFAVCDLKQGDFPDQNAIAVAAMKLRKGEVSDFTSTGMGRALLVVCEDRVPGDAAKAQIWKLQVRGEVEALQRRQIPESWRKWNLDRLGFEPGEGASVVDAEIDE